ncbi:MAG: YabP/YqfC family sporulation protein [Firmicutes bacterium]|nr:YabP/YqfC family sporulation protein [Bacillota bacterium]
MSFYQEIGNILGLDWAHIAGGYSLVNYNGEAVYIEGVKKLLVISDTEIIVDTGKPRIRVSGEGLAIFSLEEKTMVVKGTINRTEEV